MSKETLSELTKTDNLSVEELFEIRGGASINAICDKKACPSQACTSGGCNGQVCNTNACNNRACTTGGEIIIAKPIEK